MRPITLYTANCRGNKFNACYPVKHEITSVEDLRKPFGTTRSLPNTEITTEPLRILSVRIACRLTATTTIRMRNANGKTLRMWKRLFRTSRST